MSNQSASADSSTAVRDSSEPAGGEARILRWEVILLGLVVLAILITRYPSLDTNLLDAGHAHRQTHTAFQTVGFYESGIDLLHPITPVLGDPWQIPNEFPLFQAVASVFMSWGVPADPANRITGLGFFVVTALLLWVLVRRMAGRTVAAVALVVFSFSPYSMLWSRASVVEYLATAATLGWILAAVYWLATKRWRWAVAGIVAGSVAALVKGSTPISWFVLFLLVGSWAAETKRDRFRVWLRERLHPAFLSMIVIPMVALLWWTNHADSIKAASQATRPLTVVESRSYWIGTVQQRLDASNWNLLFDRVESLLVGRGWLIIAIAAVVAVARNRAAWLGMLLVPIVAIGGLFGAYLEVEYYFAAVSPALAALLALGIVSLVSWVRIKRRYRGIGIAAITAFWLALNLFLTYAHWSDAYRLRGLPRESVEIAALTEPDERVLVGGIWYDPRILYYADRWGLMLAEPWVTRSFVESQPDLDQYRALYSASPLSHLVDWAAVRPWYSPVSPNTLRLGGTRQDLGDVELAATTQPITNLLDVVAAPPSIVPTDWRILCNGTDSLRIPGGSGPVWLSLRSEGGARAVMRPGLIPVPSESLTLVWSPPAGETDRPAEVMSCHAELPGGVLHVRFAVEVSATDAGG